MSTSRLEVKCGPRHGESIPLTPGCRIVFGRDVTADEQITDTAMSRRHFRVEGQPDGSFRLIDMMSSNGTFVNGERVPRAALDDLDEILAGETRFLVHLDAKRSQSGSSWLLVDDAFEAKNATFVGKVEFDAAALLAPDESAAGEVERGARNALNVIFEVSRTMNSEPDPRKLFAVIAELIFRTITCDRVSLVIYDEETRQLEVVAQKTRPGCGLAEDAPVSKSVTMQAIRNGVTINQQDTGADSKFSAMQSIVTLNIKSVLCAPLVGGQQPVGAIYCDSIGTQGFFSDTDINLLAAVGRLAGVAIERAHLAEEALEAEKFKQALDIARNIQRSLLPAKMPEIPGLDLAGFSKPCEQTGGDYYDVIAHADGTLSLVVGDVSGHGIGSALLMATARAFLKAIALEVRHPAKVLAKVNTLLAADTDDEHFMTMFYGVFDPKRGALHYASAGHDEPIFFKTKQGKAYMLDSTGMPLGMMEGSEYELKANLKVDAGDILLIMTDGVWEAMNEREEEYGKARVAKLLRNHAAMSASDIVTALLQEVRDFIGNAPMRDDLTVVIAKFNDPRACATAPSDGALRPAPSDGALMPLG